MKKIILLVTLIFWGFTNDACAWTGDVPVQSPIRASDINEIRNVIALKRACYNLPAVTYTDSGLNAGVKFKAVHITELRDAINDLYVRCAAGQCSGGTGNWNIANATWSDPSLVGRVFRAQHINELRSILDDLTCNPYTYNWLVSGYSICSGGIGNWTYGAWDPCTGGSGTYSYGAWGNCSASCGGGSSTRSYTCDWILNTGSQARTRTCVPSSNTGTQTQTVQCQRSDSVIVSNSYCTTPMPPTSQTCTPTNNSVCGASAPIVRSCTPAGAAVCIGAPATGQVCNTQSCAVDCVGAWGPCGQWGNFGKMGNSQGIERYLYSTSASGGGAPCPFANGTIRMCQLTPPPDEYNGNN